MILRRLRCYILKTSLHNNYRYLFIFPIAKCHQSTDKLFSDAFYSSKQQCLQLQQLVISQSLTSEQMQLVSSKSVEQLLRQFNGQFVNSSNRYMSIFLKKLFQFGLENTLQLRANYFLLLKVIQQLKVNLFSFHLTTDEILALVIFFKKVKQVQNQLIQHQSFSLSSNSIIQPYEGNFHIKIIVIFTQQIINNSYSLYQASLGYHMIKYMNHLNVEVHLSYRIFLFKHLKHLKRLKQSHPNNNSMIQRQQLLVLKSSIIVLSQIPNDDSLRSINQTQTIQFLIFYTARQLNKKIAINHHFIDQNFSIYEIIQLWKSLSFINTTQFTKYIQQQLQQLIHFNHYLTDKLATILIKQIQIIQQNISYFRETTHQKPINLLNQQILISILKIFPKSISNISTPNNFRQLFQTILAKCMQFTTINCQSTITHLSPIQIPDLQTIKLPTFLQQPKNILKFIQSFFWGMMKHSQILPYNQRQQFKSNFINLLCFLPHYGILHDYFINKNKIEYISHSLSIFNIVDSVAQIIVKIFYQYLNGYKNGFYKSFIIQIEDWVKIFQSWIKLAQSNQTILWKVYFAFLNAIQNFKIINTQTISIKSIQKIQHYISLIKQKTSLTQTNNKYSFPKQSNSFIQNALITKQYLKLYAFINININQNTSNLIDSQLYIKLQHQFENSIKQNLQCVIQSIFYQTLCFNQKLTLEKISQIYPSLILFSKNINSQKFSQFYFIFQQFLKNKNSHNLNQITKSITRLEQICSKKIQISIITRFLSFVDSNPSLITVYNIVLIWIVAMNSTFLVYTLRALTNTPQFLQYKVNRFLNYQNYQLLSFQQKSLYNITQSQLCKFITDKISIELQKISQQIDKTNNRQSFRFQSLSYLVKKIATGVIFILPQYLKSLYQPLLDFLVTYTFSLTNFDILNFIEIVFNLQTIGFQYQQQFQQGKEQQYFSQFFLSKPQIEYYYKLILQYPRQIRFTQMITFIITYRNSFNIFKKQLFLCYLGSFNKEVIYSNNLFSNKQIFLFLSNLKIQSYQQVATILRYSDIYSTKYQSLIRYIDQIANHKNKKQSFSGYDRRKIMLIIYCFNPISLPLYGNPNLSQITNQFNLNLLSIFVSIKKMLKRGVYNSIINQVDQLKANKRILIIQNILINKIDPIIVNNKLKQVQDCYTHTIFVNKDTPPKPNLINPILILSKQSQPINNFKSKTYQSKLLFKKK